jgi:hypothetical protein
MKNIQIGSGLTAEVPEGYDVIEEPDGAVAVFPTGDESVTVRFNSMTFNPVKPVDNAALLYVRESSKQSRRTFKLYGEKGVSQYEEDTNEDGEALLIKYWEVALDTRLAIVSATILAEKKDDPAVTNVLNAIPSMIDSLKYSPPDASPPPAQA